MPTHKAQGMPGANRAVWLTKIVLAAWGVAGCTTAPTARRSAEPESAWLAADHHVHILGPTLLRDWKTLGARFSRPDAEYSTVDGLLGAAGQRPKVRHALLVPMAHLYGNSEFRAGLRLDLDEERARTAAENDAVGAEAARHPGRSAALCSASVLRPYAAEELRRCRERWGSRGIKLHLASSEVDLQQPEHRQAVERLLAWAEKQELLVLLHLDPQRRGLQAADVAHFAREVLEPHPRLRLIVAHLGGSGGYGPWTRSVFRTLVAWLEQRQAATGTRPPVYFDLSAVLLEHESEGVPASSSDDAAALAEDLRRAGLGSVVLGSDFPVFDPQRSARWLFERTGLTLAEQARLKAQVVPGLFEPLPRSGRGL